MAYLKCGPQGPLTLDGKDVTFQCTRVLLTDFYINNLGVFATVSDMGHSDHLTLAQSCCVWFQCSHYFKHPPGCNIGRADIDLNLMVVFC